MIIKSQILEGYIENSDKTRCIPECVDPCKHGVCVAPNECSCEHGYGGPTCNISKFYILQY